MSVGIACKSGWDVRRSDKKVIFGELGMRIPTMVEHLEHYRIVVIQRQAWLRFHVPSELSTYIFTSIDLVQT